MLPRVETLGYCLSSPTGRVPAGRQEIARQFIAGWTSDEKIGA